MVCEVECVGWSVWDGECMRWRVSGGSRVWGAGCVGWRMCEKVYR